MKFLWKMEHLFVEGQISIEGNFVKANNNNWACQSSNVANMEPSSGNANSKYLKCIEITTALDLLPLVCVFPLGWPNDDCLFWFSTSFQVGTIGGTYLAALLIHHFNSWHQVFYVFGLATIVWCFLFVRFHRLNYLSFCTVTTVAATASFPPY